MKEIGLQPTTDEPGGKETGQSVTHHIVPGGRIRASFAKLATTGFRLNWKAASKTKYTCPTCGANAWAKPNTPLICRACYEDEDGELTIMTAEILPDEQQEAA